jgi:hypothetical protein
MRRHRPSVLEMGGVGSYPPLLETAAVVRVHRKQRSQAPQDPGGDSPK